MTEEVQREPIKLVGDIIKAELGIDDTHILLENQDFPVPNDEKLFVSLSYVGGTKIGGSSYLDTDANKEVQEVYMNHLVQIDLLSLGSAARLAKEEAIMALSSIKSEQVQEENDIQICDVPSEFVNVSALEGVKMLTRFTATVTVKAVHRKEKTTGQYYDDFRAKIHTDPDPEISVPDQEVTLND